MIIFDLDDTLIDTSGSVTPFKMKQCVQKCLQLGLPIVDTAAAVEQLLALNAQSPKSTDALATFLAPYRPTKTQSAALEQELTSLLPPDFLVSTTPDAKEILQFYKTRCPLVLVTGGHPPFQWDKLKKAGIARSIFSMIAIPEDSKKGPHYEAAQRKFLVPPDKIWVCGDRVAMDLAPAHELGFHTVHMRWGRGKLHGGKEPWIDRSIHALRELKEVIR